LRVSVVVAARPAGGRIVEAGGVTDPTGSSSSGVGSSVTSSMMTKGCDVRSPWSKSLDNLKQQDETEVRRLSNGGRRLRHKGILE
jgi:hypothetical protein